MKKEYKTPYLIMESFQLDAAVATSCSGAGRVALNHDINSCDLDSIGIEYFGSACDMDIVNNPGGDDDDTFCYHGPVDPNVNFLAS